MTLLNDLQNIDIKALNLFKYFAEKVEYVLYHSKNINCDIFIAKLHV